MESRAPNDAEQAEIASLEARVEAARRALPDLPVPAFAALRIKSGGRSREHLLGPRTSIGAELSILDWRHAPLAQAFFGFDRGEDFEIEIDQRLISGTVEERALLEIEPQRGLVAIESRGVLLRRIERGWEAIDRPDQPLFLPRSRAARERPAVPGMVPLDAQQRRAVELPEGRSLLILGEAGFGKTTVALHRMAKLAADAQHRGRPFRGLVIVPTKGLERLSRLMLERLAVRGVEVATFEGWVKEQARRAFPDLPERDSRDTTAAIIRLKRHPELRRILPEIASRQRRGARSKAARRSDLLHLFGDRAILERVAAAAKLPQHAVAEVLEHTHVQFSRTTEQQWSHVVERERLEALDGNPLDEGTPDQDAESIDTEDCAVLFEIQRQRSGIDAAPKGSFRRYDQILVDEAQELAAIELAVIGRARAPEGAIMVAGDDQQQIDDTACFAGWKAVMTELAIAEHEAVLLKESYRCPPEVTRFARGLVGRLPPGEPAAIPAATAASLIATAVPTACHLGARLIEQLRRFESSDPTATIAVICKTADAARQTEASLSRGLATRLALNGEFDFRPGVVVTAIPEVKGLEFDLVVLPDVDLGSIASVEGRRALYVAVTRALHAVWMLQAPD